MILGPHNILKDMCKHKPMKYKPLKQNSIEKAKKKKKSKENKKPLCINKKNNFIMAQKSSKGLSTLSKHMTNDTKLQLDQNTVTTKLIIPVLTTPNPNASNGEMYINSTSNLLFIYKNNTWVQIV